MSQPAQTTAQVSAEEIARFGRLAPRWWDENGPMRPLHRMNDLRVAWIDSRIPDRNALLLDLGCGAGIAAEALARLGHCVLGLDASAEAIAAATGHAAGCGLDLHYRQGIAEDLIAADRRFGVITALEVIEHVPDPAAFLRLLSDLLNPGGLLFISTLNRTLRSLAFAKIGAEYVAGLLPRGTHDWRKFIPPEALAGYARDAGLRLTDISGMAMNPITGNWRETTDVGVNYISVFTSK